jgi:hypothetical protein
MSVRTFTTPQRSPIGLASGLLTLILAGCSAIGPGLLPRDRVDYAEALSDSWKDQLLLNIVRLRYGDSPTFLDVSSVVGAYDVQHGLAAGVTGNFGLPSINTPVPRGFGFLSATRSYTDRPTISYTPLTGKRFTQSMLEPVPAAAIFSLIADGYAADFVLPVTVRALNGVYNRTLEGVARRPSDPAFYPLIEAMRRIQLSRSFSMRIDKRGADQVTIGVFTTRHDPQLQRDIEFVEKTLNLTSIKNGEMVLSYGPLPHSPNELAVLSRSMIEVMSVLAGEIEVPEEHVSQGRTYANAALGLNPPGLDLPYVRIHSSATRPSNDFTAVQYGDSWYWISDNDFESKRRFTTLLLFFSLAETGVSPAAPVLTLPVQ